MSPIAITVAPTMPVVAARRAPTKTTEMPSPPGIGPKSWAIATSRSSAIRDRCSMIPMNMKRGIAMRVSRSTSQYRLRKFVTPAVSQSIGPPWAK